MLAGKLRDRIAFDKRVQNAGDGYGNFETDWVHQFTVPGRKRLLVGSEPVIAARLTGVSPGIITVRDTSWTRQVTAAWRCRHVRGSKTVQNFNIKSVTPSEKPHHIDFLVEVGTAEG